MTRQPSATSTSTPALTARVGWCQARVPGGTCPCESLTSPINVAGYRTCACGHTQYSHDVPAALPLAG